MIKQLRSDYDTKFRNVTLESVEKGIVQNFSAVRTPEKNGVAEGRNMTLIKAARTMVVDASLSILFWNEAINIAYYS